MAAICEPGGKGLILPLSEAESDLPDSARAVIYILVLFWMFMGVGSVADRFMSAVEKIISKKRRVFNEDKQRWVTYLVWNSTVADLTLLALGSSAPEILLSILEMLSNEFYSGELGPSTIVGSAAFNLLIITAVCVCSIPKSGVRRIASVSVYHVTLVFGTFAYLWLLAIVQYISPSVVEPWEAVITFLMFPLLVTVCWLANKGKMEFMALEKKPAEESNSLLADDEQPEVSQIKSEITQNLRSSTHPRLSKRNSLQPGNGNKPRTSVMSGNEMSAVGEDGEDKATPAGSNGKEIYDKVGAMPILAPHGILTWRSDAIEVSGSEEVQTIELDILRCNGSSGEVSCTLKTEGLSAVPGIDFTEIDTKIHFEDGETYKQITLEVKPQRADEPHDVLQLQLAEAEGGPFFNPNDDGGKGCSLLTVTIRNRDNTSLGSMLIDSDNLRYGFETWKDNIINSIKMEEAEAEEGEDPPAPSPCGYIAHVIGLPFNVLFAVVCPPNVWAGGWLLFVVALMWVAVVTALITDLASLFGCCAGIADSVTAITIVALGTSLPDTFASMSSAAKDDTADSSIVNVTGSNSVNVFLGIGIPWLGATIYWASMGATDAWKERYQHLPNVLADYPNGAFVVEAGALAFSVLIFSCMSFICLAILRIRRLSVGGELGGPNRIAKATAVTFVCLWATYIGLSIWRTSSEDAEVMMPVMCGLALLVVLGTIGFELSGKGRFDAEEAAVAPNDVEQGTLSKAEGGWVKEEESVDQKDPLEPSKIGAAIVEEPNAQEPPVEDAAESAASAQPESPVSEDLAVDEGKLAEKAADGEAAQAAEKKRPKKKAAPKAAVAPEGEPKAAAKKRPVKKTDKPEG